jgi:hypothetical protein
MALLSIGVSTVRAHTSVLPGGLAMPYGLEGWHAEVMGTKSHLSHPLRYNCAIVTLYLS